MKKTFFTCAARNPECGTEKPCAVMVFQESDKAERHIETKNPKHCFFDGSSAMWGGKQTAGCDGSSINEVAGRLMGRISDIIAMRQSELLHQMTTTCSSYLKSALERELENVERDRQDWIRVTAFFQMPKEE